MKDYDAPLAALTAGKEAWAKTSTAERVKVLKSVKKATAQVAEGWALASARGKLIPGGSPLVGEEWLLGPYALLAACDALIETLEQMDGRRCLQRLRRRYTASGQLALRVLPRRPIDELLFSGVSAEVWMEKGLSEVGLKDATASAYAVPEAERKGAVALVLGAGNVSSIAPLDCFQKLFQEHQVVLLKMNPVNAHLADHLRAALRPLIERDALRIVEGNGAAGAYLTEHSSVDEVHITGAEATHDAIVWGQGEAAEKARKSGTPRNPRRITSELGAVCPTIVVPGPWSRADILFQAEHIATQKMQNSGFNCVACQVLVMPGEWDLKDRLLREVKRVIARQTRLAYYPGAEARLADFAEAGEAEQIARGDAPAFPLAPHRPGLHAETEIFAPAMSVKEIGGEGAGYLEAAIAFANEGLRGTLGANIIIHPKTLEAMGKRRLDALLGELRYGAIGVNIWSGAAFAFPHLPWGAFPGHTLADVGSGIGKVHNAFMFDRAEKAVVWGPWAPFPRSLKEGQGTLMPKPPWFVTHKSADKAAAALTEFTAKPKLGRLARLIWHNLRG